MSRITSGEKLKQVILGITGVGKTQLIEANEEKQKDESDMFDLLSNNPPYFSTQDFEEHKIKIHKIDSSGMVSYNGANQITCYDTAGQVNIKNKNSILRLVVPWANIGIVYVIDSRNKHSINALNDYDNEVNSIFQKMPNRRIPHKSIYISCSYVNESFVNIKEVLEGEYLSIQEVIDFYDKIYEKPSGRITSLFVGDSVGRIFKNLDEVLDLFDKDYAVKVKEQISNKESIDKDKINDVNYVINKVLEGDMKNEIVNKLKLETGPNMLLIKNRDFLMSKPYSCHVSAPFSMNVINQMYDNEFEDRASKLGIDKILTQRLSETLGIFPAH